MMNTDQRTTRYAVHGVSITVSAADAALWSAAHALLAAFSAPLGGASSAERLAITLARTAPPDSPPADARTWMEIDSLRLLTQGDASYLLLDGEYVARLDHVQRHIGIWVRPSATFDSWTITHLVLQPLLTEALRSAGFVALHAAALTYDGQAVLFPAESGSGKTALALALLRGGFRLLSDDSPLLRREQDRVVARAFPEPLNVTPRVLSWFPELRPHLAASLGIAGIASAKFPVASEAVYGDCLAELAPVRIIVFPEPIGRARTHIHSLRKQEALLRLLPLVMTSAQPRYARDQFQLLSALVRGATCYAMDTGRDFERLPALMTTLLRDGGVAERRTDDA